ncbi:MAG TPA: hypothetical protein VJ901_11005, partial [Thermoanaerobaculia bacterium]|nr:hypothetical protein [Thermoanaerobaculia bacterium]
AEYRLSQGALDSARSALDALAPAAQNECDVLAVRRKLAQLEGAPAVPSALPQPQALRWSDTGALSVCIDTQRELLTSIEAAKPAFIAWGWNEGRNGVLYLAPGRTNVRVSTGNRTGRQAFFVRTLAGGPVTLGNAEIR